MELTDLPFHGSGWAIPSFKNNQSIRLFLGAAVDEKTAAEMNIVDSNKVHEKYCIS